MQFLDFNLESSSSCAYDWIEVRDGDTDSANVIGSKLCGADNPEPIVSSGNSLHVFFRTDGSVVRTGFKIRVGAGKNNRTKYNILNTIFKDIIFNNRNIFRIFFN